MNVINIHTFQIKKKQRNLKALLGGLFYSLENARGLKTMPIQEVYTQLISNSY